MCPPGAAAAGGQGRGEGDDWEPPWGRELQVRNPGRAAPAGRSPFCPGQGPEPQGGQVAPVRVLTTVFPVRPEAQPHVLALIPIWCWAFHFGPHLHTRDPRRAAASTQQRGLTASERKKAARICLQSVGLWGAGLGPPQRAG